MRDRQDGAGGTLDRLNDALSSLEDRIGIARNNAPTPNYDADTDALSAIRARQSALGSPRASQTAPRTQNASTNFAANGVDRNILRDELASLRRELENEMNANVSAGFNALRGDLNSMRSSNAQAQSPAVSAATTQLRQEIAELKNDVAKLAREDTLQGMIERWGVLENEISDLPRKLGSRDDLIAMAERLDGVQSAIAGLPQTNELVGIEEQVRTLAMAVEQVAAGNGSAGFPIEAIDNRFDELTRAIAALPANIPTAPAFDPSAFDRIEARIGSLASQLDEQAKAPIDSGLEAQFAELSNSLQFLREETRSAIPHDAINSLSKQLDAIAENIAAQPTQTPSQIDEQRLDEMNERLLHIIERVNGYDEHAAQSAQTISASLDQKMEEIASRIEASERESAAVPSVNSLEMRLDEIAQILSNGHTAREPGANHDQLASMEAQIINLTQSLSAGPAPVDQDSLLSAARAAAEEAVARMGANTDNPANENLLHLAGDLKALEELARDSDDRNSRTFEAIHDTLLKVVDHLGGLEETIRSAPAAPTFAPEPQPAPMSTFANTADDTQSASAPLDAALPHTPQTPRMEVGDAPSISPADAFDGDFDGLADAPQESIEPQMPRGAMSPAQAAAAAARAALKDNTARTEQPDVVVEAAEPAPQAESKSLLKGMARKLRRGSASVVDEVETATPSVRVAAEANMDAELVSDEPIEPGSGGADLSAIMRRVREERSGTNPAAPTAAPKDIDDNGKSDFIAAARRAAKAAAADATVAKRDNEKSSDKKSLGAMLAQRRKPILMGAGAILLALLSLPLISGFFNSGDAPKETVQQSTESAPIVEPTQDELAIEGNAVRNVEDTTAALPLEDPLALDVEEDTQVEAADSAPEPDYTIDDVPENVGPIVLREAAANGDAKALYVVGDYYTGGVPGQSENDLAKALQWYERSAELGFAPAQYRVGNFYEKGIGTSRDLETAKTWYQLAAEQGNAAAMHNLAVLFASGADGAPDFASATKWFRDAAELGVKDSQFNLGILSAKGEGIAQDLTESYKWFAIAAKTGDKDAEAKRDEVADALRPDQLEIARGATELWKPKPLIEDVNMVTIPEEWQTDVAQTAAKPAPKVNAAEMKKAVRNIQGILNNNGYNAGPADGIMGAKTRNAIIAFKKANGLPANAEINEALVRKLLALNESRKNG